MGEFHISKQQVLNEIYIRELPLIFNYINKQRKRREIEEIVRCKNLLKIAVVTAGLIPSKEEIDALFNEYKRQAFELADINKESAAPQDPYEQLRRLQGFIAQKRRGKRGSR